MADDASAAGLLQNLLEFSKFLQDESKRYGYCINAKSWLILKNESDFSSAKDLFRECKIQITTEGQRHSTRGALLSSVSFKESYVSEKVNQWVKELEKLTDTARSQPQSAYSAYVNGYKHKFTYFMRTIPDIAIQLQPIEDLIHRKLFPAVMNSDVSSLDKSLFTLPTKYGGEASQTL